MFLQHVCVQKEVSEERLKKKSHTTKNILLLPFVHFGGVFLWTFYYVFECKSIPPAVTSASGGGGLNAETL